MRNRLRQLIDRAGLPPADLVLAGIFVVAAVLWAIHMQDGSDTILPRPVFPLPPEVPPVPSVDRGEEGADSQAMIVNVLPSLALAFRRRLPFSAFVVAIGGIFLIQNGMQWPGFVAILICAYSAVAYGRSVPSASVLLITAAAITAALFNGAIPEMPGWLSPFVVFLPAGLGAAALRSARERALTAARRADALEAEQEESARAAIAEERARIARELHDVVSHHVSVMVIQAGGAGQVIGERPDLAREALSAIETSGRAAMAELRHLLGVLAPADERLRPQPGLADLDDLLGSVRAAGQPVTVVRDGSEVPAGVDLTAYRIVQEGLTNALRYAPGAPTAVAIRREGDDLVVEVTNEAGGGAPAGQGAGRGLIGLRERLRLHDGKLSARPAPGGGFRLTARIPAQS
ncbi:sensor histidine kinase [Hamadaea tsunoensis]|uniref:sensor histidine kinase n=1 Tax=Hamadaea tsunoensis TaxID=53368 RepID=UPI0012FA2E8C|nr:sensor histidine kinase [Hamadaea tsunoensis]